MDQKRVAHSQVKGPAGSCSPPRPLREQLPLTNISPLVLVSAGSQKCLPRPILKQEWYSPDPSGQDRGRHEPWCPTGCDILSNREHGIALWPKGRHESLFYFQSWAEREGENAESICHTFVTRLHPFVSVGFNEIEWETDPSEEAISVYLSVFLMSWTSSLSLYILA